MKHIGIWIDKKKTHVITVKDDGEDVVTIISGIENFRIHGGSGTQIKGGPQDVVQDSKYLEREKHQFREYAKRITSHIRDADRIVIYGPAEMPERFHKELTENYKDIGKKVKDILKANSMTDNQTKALIRSYFDKYRHIV